MNDTATLLHTFGFTTRDAVKIASRAHDKGLTLDHVQAWIDEAQGSTSIYNPLGFVRARLEDGDKPVRPPAGDPHVVNRQRYVDWARHTRFRPAYRSKHTVQTCACGIVVYTTRLCPDCGTCAKCCTCDQADPNKE